MNSEINVQYFIGQHFSTNTPLSPGIWFPGIQTLGAELDRPELQQWQHTITPIRCMYSQSMALTDFYSELHKSAYIWASTMQFTYFNSNGSVCHSVLGNGWFLYGHQGVIRHRNAHRTNPNRAEQRRVEKRRDVGSSIAVLQMKRMMLLSFSDICHNIWMGHIHTHMYTIYVTSREAVFFVGGQVSSFFSFFFKIIFHST